MSRKFLAKAKRWAGSLKQDIYALWLAGRDPRTPAFAKALAVAIAAYAISPIDLIPDFVPIIGYLDDLIIVPLGILWAIRLIPPVLMNEFRRAAIGRPYPISRMAPILIVMTWIACLILLVSQIYNQH